MALWCVTVDGFTHTSKVEPKNCEKHELYLYNSKDIAENEFIIIQDMLPELFLPESTDDDGYLLPAEDSPFAIDQDSYLLHLHELPDLDGSDQQFLRIQMREIQIMHDGYYKNLFKDYADWLMKTNFYEEVEDKHVPGKK